jgi:hypothetical protein
MMTGGSDYVGDRWLFVGPAVLPFDVPIGRVRLNAFGHQVYLGRTVQALITAIHELTNEVASNSLRPVGEPALERRGADIVGEGWIEVFWKKPPVKERSEPLRIE